MKSLREQIDKWVKARDKPWLSAVSRTLFIIICEELKLLQEEFENRFPEEHKINALVNIWKCINESFPEFKEEIEQLYSPQRYRISAN